MTMQIAQLFADSQARPAHRPAGETHLAIIRAANAYRVERAQSGQGATMLELVHRAQVGYKVARAMVPKLKSRGHLEIVGERKVDYRNRPVAEYAPTTTQAALTTPASTDGAHNDLQQAFHAWMIR